MIEISDPRKVPVHANGYLPGQIPPVGNLQFGPLPGLYPIRPNSSTAEINNFNLDSFKTSIYSVVGSGGWTSYSINEFTLSRVAPGYGARKIPAYFINGKCLVEVTLIQPTESDLEREKRHKQLQEINDKVSKILTPLELKLFKEGCLK